MSHLGGSLSQLVESRSYLEESWTIWKGPGAVRASELDGSPGRGGRRQTERERQNGAFLVCDGALGHFPHRGRCPKAKTMSKTVFQGLSDETLCNLLGFIQAEQYRFRLVHLRTIIVNTKLINS